VDLTLPGDHAREPGRRRDDQRGRPRCSTAAPARPRATARLSR
jgi:hypothetical protein